MVWNPGFVEGPTVRVSPEIRLSASDRNEFWGERGGARPRDRPVDTEARSGAWASMLLQPKSVLSDHECMPVQYMI